MRNHSQLRRPKWTTSTWKKKKKKQIPNFIFTLCECRDISQSIHSTMLIVIKHEIVNRAWPKWNSSIQMYIELKKKFQVDKRAPTKANKNETQIKSHNKINARITMPVNHNKFIVLTKWIFEWNDNIVIE